MVESIDQLAGLARTNPAMAFFLAMLLFSMAGVPPLAGFFAKFYVFLAAIKAGLYMLAVIGVLASVVGAYYYLRSSRSCISTSRRSRSYSMPYELKLVLGGLRPVQHPLLRLSGTARRRRQRRRPFAVLMQLDPAAAAAGVSPGGHETLARPMRKRWRRRAAASAVRCGSPRSGRRRAAAGAATRGSRCPAISTPRCFWTIRRRPNTRRNCRSSPLSRFMTPSSSCAPGLRDAWR